MAPKSKIELDDARSDGGRTAVADRKCRTEIPTDEEMTIHDLPNGYRIKYCKLCDLSSITKTPLVDPTFAAAWGDLIPWGNGTRNAPSGVFCRWVCLMSQSI